ncbi:MAG TPA: SgcJ/EcaC family oxidoreductase, partial [Thermomicrobiales bacterium]|nr:SgcJ/EcaC family oxidoreductase [Thermomicrobiales bacterium]
TLDPDAGAAVYTENAEWLNAFGDWVQGRENIRAKLTELFASDEFAAGTIVGQPSGSVTVLTDSTAVGWTYQEIEDQQVAGSDETIPLRKNHSLAVLVKEGDQWLIAAHMFMDENII